MLGNVAEAELVGQVEGAQLLLCEVRYPQIVLTEVTGSLPLSHVPHCLAVDMAHYHQAAVSKIRVGQLVELVVEGGNADGAATGHTVSARLVPGVDNDVKGVDGVFVTLEVRGDGREEGRSLRQLLSVCYIRLHHFASVIDKPFMQQCDRQIMGIKEIGAKEDEDIHK